MWEKDVGLALHAAHVHDLPTPLTWAARAVYEAVCSEGDGEMAGKDFRCAKETPRRNAKKLIRVQCSVVLEWLRTKQAQGVERGWKDGGPGDGPTSL